MKNLVFFITLFLAINCYSQENSILFGPFKPKKIELPDKTSLFNDHTFYQNHKFGLKPPSYIKNDLKYPGSIRKLNNRDQQWEFYSNMPVYKPDYSLKMPVMEPDSAIKYHLLVKKIKTPGNSGLTLP